MEREPRFIELKMDEPLEVKRQLEEMVPGDLCNLSLKNYNGEIDPDCFRVIYEGKLPTDFTVYNSEFEYRVDSDDSKSEKNGFSFLIPRLIELSLGLGGKKIQVSDNYKAIISYRIPEIINLEREHTYTPPRRRPFDVEPYFKGHVKRMFFVTSNFYKNFDEYPEELLKRKLALLKK